MTTQDKKYLTPIVSGFFIMIFFIVFQQFAPFEGNLGRYIQGLLSVLLRIFAGFWIASLTKQQGRKSVPFVLLSILIPAITLIIVGIMGDKEENNS